MRTDGLGEKRRNSTSGVLPIRSMRLRATGLRTPFPHIDGRAELPEQLVEPPGEPASSRFDSSFAVPLDECGSASAQARETQDIPGDVPRLVLDHPLAPL